MITFVYCCICLLIVCCHTTRTESEEYGFNNDLPDTLDTEPEVASLTYKAGAHVSMKCNNHHPNKNNITWEFKHCKGMLCDKKNVHKLLYNDSDWKKVQQGKKKKLEIKNATEDNIGFYRCLYNDSIIKIYILDLATMKYKGPPPEILDLIPSSPSPVTPNVPLIIQCKASSEKPAEIRWFKECIKCDMPYDGHCYCALPVPLSNSLYSRINNIYTDKLNIYNPRSVDSGTYICVVINVYGEDHRNITIKVDDLGHSQYEDKRNSFSLLFLIPLILILVPVLIWLCFNKRKKNSRRHLNEHQKQLIKPVVEFDIALNVDDII